MKRAILVLVIALGCTSVNAAGRAEAQCTAPPTVEVVKDVIRAQMAPLSHLASIPAAVFYSGTRIASVEPTRYDADLQIAECSALFTVDASAGIDAETARILEMRNVRSPDLLLMLQLLLSQPPKGRVYDFPISYRSQIKCGQNVVQVRGLNEFKVLVTGGLLAAKADSLGRAAHAASDTQALAAPGPEPESPSDVAAREFAEADKRLNAAYKKVMAALTQDGKEKLRAEQRGWIRRRDKACTQDPDAGVGANSAGALEASACATKFTNDRTAELLKLPASK